MKRLGLCLFASACGYTVVGAAPPLGMSRVAVVPFDELTPVGMAPHLATALAAELAASGLAITTDAAGADGVVTGMVTSATTTGSPTSGDPAATVQAYRLAVTIDARLNDRAGAERWRATLALGEDFLASLNTGPTGPVETEAARRRALHRLAERFAREIHTRLVVASSEEPHAAAN
jgi:outer membrane lipopolysaccharide assembly protein LptE/RlpB